MSGESEAVEALQQVLGSIYTPVHAAGAAFVKAWMAKTRTTDLVETMQCCVSIIIAAEHLKDVAAEAEKSVRSILGDTMGDTGATTIHTEFQRAWLSKKAAFVDISQPELVPQEYYTTPEPVIDRKRIKADIEAGVLVPGTTLMRPNGYTLSIGKRKE